MPQNYIVQNVKPNIDKETGQQRVDNYGNKKYYVLFQGESENVPLSAKNEPQVGDEKYGEIVEGQYGKYFKTAKDPNKSFGGGSKYDGDGQKQGMAIKSAADYVTRHSDKKLPPEQFAKAVEAYATALYNLELKKQPPAPASWEAMREKKNEILARVEEEREPVAVTANGNHDVIVEDIDDTPIRLEDIPF